MTVDFHVGRVLLFFLFTLAAIISEGIELFSQSFYDEEKYLNYSENNNRCEGETFYIIFKIYKLNYNYLL